MRRTVTLLLGLILIFTLAACSSTEIELSSTPTSAPSTNNSGDDSVTLEDEDTSHIVYITLGDKITIDGDGAIVEGSTVSITSSGTYYISGTLKDGQIRVYTADSGTVKLVLSGADITCSTSAPIYIINAQKTVITLADGSENYLTDATSYVYENGASDEPNAAVFSNDDLTINGNGSLTVSANYNDGIKSHDDLKITGGDITVNAVDDGIIGRDSLTVKDGNITVNSGGDGMRASNDEDEAQGYIVIEGGTINITSGTDGIQAETSVTISGGDITISSGGGSAFAFSSSKRNRNHPGPKAIKAGTDITIEGGTIYMNSFDDSINSNGSITINDGNISIASGEDGLHADSSIEINGGDIRIVECFEGIDGATITINDGNIHITSSNDGINVVADREHSGDFNIYINGGYTVINPGDDCIDAHGGIYMTNGVLIVYGSHAGVFDYQYAFEATGGMLIRANLGGGPNTTPSGQSQYSIKLHFTSTQPIDSIIHIESEDGEVILTLMPPISYNGIQLCSPKLTSGRNYIVYSGGSSTGTVLDGLYSGETYTAGTELGRFTITRSLTTDVFFD